MFENDAGFKKNEGGCNNNHYKKSLRTYYYISVMKTVSFSSMRILIDVKMECKTLAQVKMGNIRNKGGIHILIKVHN